MDNIKILKDALEKLNIEAADSRLSAFKTYMDGILELNSSINLTAITDPGEFIIKHYVDSAVCLNYEEYKGAKRIIDVGTGAGFPGIPLAILSEDKEFVLMDSLNKRLKIIDKLSSEAGITNVTTIHARAEELARNKEHREKYDLCVSRAVANLATLSEYCLPFIKTGGWFMAYKGPDADEEIRVASKAIEVLGGRIEEVRDAKMEEYGISHRIVLIKKVRSTPKTYPRKAGTPSEKPIK